jgi:hypothetical protein
VRGGEPCPLLVRELDVVEARGHLALTEEDDRGPGPDALQLVAVQPGHGENDAVVHLQAGDAQRLDLAPGARAGALEDEMATAVLHQGRDLVGDVAEVVVEARHDQGDRVGPARSQVSRREVDLVPELLDSGQHPLPCGRDDAAVAVEHVGDGHRRDAGLARDVAHRDHVLLPPGLDEGVDEGPALA